MTVMGRTMLKTTPRHPVILSGLPDRTRHGGRGAKARYCLESAGWVDRRNERWPCPMMTETMVRPTWALPSGEVVFVDTEEDGGDGPREARRA